MSLVSEPPETRYADTGEGFVAYQQFGRGSTDLVMFTSMDSNAVAIWDNSSAVRYFERLASFSRVLYFDHRGSGVSDPVPLAKPPTFDSWTDDARVMRCPQPAWSGRRSSAIVREDRWPCCLRRPIPSWSLLWC